MKQPLPFILLTAIFYLHLQSQVTFAQIPSLTWAKNFGKDSTFPVLDHPVSAIDNKGNVYIAGIFQGTADFNPGIGVYNLTAIGQCDIYVCKLDTSGNLVWAKQIGGFDQERSSAITVDTKGYVYLSGLFRGTVDFDPSPGVSMLTSPTAPSSFISKFDTSGNLVWAKGAITASTKVFTVSTLGFTLISVDSSGNVYTAGSFRDSVDFDPGASTFILNALHNNVNDAIDGFILKSTSYTPYPVR